jgi:hypothetical protein
MKLPFAEPPASLCIVRLSAIAITRRWRAAYAAEPPSALAEEGARN